MPVPIKGTISGSRAAAVLGLNKWMTQFEAWQYIMEERESGFNKKNGYEFVKFDGNAATRFGHAFESAAIQLTESKLHIKVTGQEKVFRKTYNKVPLSCHVDGDNVYEGKTTTMHGFMANWGLPESGRIPKSPMIQVQHNMYLSGTDEAVVSCLVFPETPEKWEEMGWRVTTLDELDVPPFIFNNSGYWLKNGIRTVDPKDWAFSLADMGYHHLYHIKRDDELIAKMLEKYEEFWSKYVITGTPPEPMNVDDIKRLCPDVSGTIIIEDETLLGWIEEYKEIGKEIGTGGNLSKRRDQLKTAFLDGCRKLGKTIDDESVDKWIFRDGRGNKLGSWGKNKNGNWVFR